MVTLSREPWARLQRISMRLGLGADGVDAAIAKLDAAHDLGGFVREAMNGRRRRKS